MAGVWKASAEPEVLDCPLNGFLDTGAGSLNLLNDLGNKFKKDLAEAW